MALDSVALSKLRFEIENKIKDGRIDKIHQPEKDELSISIRTYRDSFKIVVSASPSNARVHFTESFKENPKVAPMFCMLLRKHLGGGKIISVSQPQFERILDFSVESRNELGDLVIRHLIVELTGRNSNIILTDENGKILDSARRVDFTQSSVRQILPGITYSLPPKQEKTDFLDFNKKITLDFSDKSALLKDLILSSVAGISPVISREIVWQATRRCDTTVRELDENGIDLLLKTIEQFREKVKNKDFSPVVITEKETGRILDFSVFDIKHFENVCSVESYESMSDAIYDFYFKRAEKERIKQKTQDILRVINTNLERLSKKLVIQQKTLKDTENKEKFRKSADLIMSSLHLIHQGDEKVNLIDYFDPEMKETTVTLSPELTPSDNAAKYYKKYQKAKTAEIEVKKQLENTKSEIEYLESVLSFIENVEDISEISAIKQELTDSGYIKERHSKGRREKEAKSLPHHFISSDGFDIYVGKNNIQNDILTLKFANTSDIWFHTKKIHGSHTVIKLGIDKDVPKETYLEAAHLAAYFSKARESSNVPVDYTEIKNVKKPSGAKPGMVIYDSYNTIYINPKSPEDLGLKTIL